MLLRAIPLFIVFFGFFATACKAPAPDVELRQDLKFLAVFSSPALATQEDDKRFSTAFQSKYRTRVVLLRPVAGQAALTQLNSRASLFAVLKINHLREARQIAREIEVALGNAALTALFPLAENQTSQDNFSGNYFYLGLEKRAQTFQRLQAQGKAEIFRHESEDLGRDRNVLSYFAAANLSDTPYSSVHILGYSGIAETQYQSIDGLYARSIRKLEAADTALVEKIR